MNTDGHDLDTNLGVNACKRCGLGYRVWLAGNLLGKAQPCPGPVAVNTYSPPAVAAPLGHHWVTDAYGNTFCSVCGCGLASPGICPGTWSVNVPAWVPATTSTSVPSDPNFFFLDDETTDPGGHDICANCHVEMCEALDAYHGTDETLAELCVKCRSRMEREVRR